MILIVPAFRITSMNLFLNDRRETTQDGAVMHFFQKKRPILNTINNWLNQKCVKSINKINLLNDALVPSGVL